MREGTDTRSIKGRNVNFGKKDTSESTRVEDETSKDSKCYEKADKPPVDSLRLSSQISHQGV